MVRDKSFKFIEEIKTVLTYTNCTPYKSKTGRYFCAYCSSDGPAYDNPSQLRHHTRTKHAEDRVKGVEAFMRPAFLNEVLKVDIHDLTCTVCFVKLNTWNDMFQHLFEKHEVVLDDAYTKMIPYELSDNLQCALCKDKFPNYHILDGHMNAHYTNYICGDCGDTFLSESRFKKHTETHNVGVFPCEFCDKVFTIEKYRKKHYDGVHNHTIRYNCNYCDEGFRTPYDRHLHMLEEHKEKVKSYSCEICGKTFNWRPYYLKHLRLTHNKKEKKHKCKLCDKSFLMRHELRNHEEWHKGTLSYVCCICKRKFSSKQYLQRHIMSHGEVIRDDPTAVIIAVENLDNSVLGI